MRSEPVQGNRAVAPVPIDRHHRLPAHDRRGSTSERFVSGGRQDDGCDNTCSGIGTEKAPSIVAELAPLIDKLAAAGVNMTEPGVTPAALNDGDTGEHTESAEPAGGPLAGMTVIVTDTMAGPLEKLSRNQMNELIEQAGGRSSYSVSKKTARVVAGDGAGSKRAKAEDLGVRLANPDEFAAQLADYLN
jgi:DNA ligase (NAD+)